MFNHVRGSDLGETLTVVTWEAKFTPIKFDLV